MRKMMKVPGGAVCNARHSDLFQASGMWSFCYWSEGSCWIQVCKVEFLLHIFINFKCVTVFNVCYLRTVLVCFTQTMPPTVFSHLVCILSMKVILSCFIFLNKYPQWKVVLVHNWVTKTFYLVFMSNVTIEIIKNWLHEYVWIWYHKLIHDRSDILIMSSPLQCCFLLKEHPVERIQIA